MKRTVIVLALAATTLTGCAGGVARMRGDAASQRYMDYAGAPIEQFTAFRLDGWTPVSRNRLVVWIRSSEAYLVTVWNTCPDLQFANRIAISSTADSVSHFEHVTVDRRTCPISEIRPIDIKQMRADQAAAAAAARGQT